MKRLARALFVFIIITTSYSRSLSQEEESATSLIVSGDALATSNPEKALALFEKAMQFSEQKKDWELYLRSVNAMAVLKLDGNEELEDHAFDLVVAATKAVKDIPKTDGVAQLHFNAGNLYENFTNEIDLPIYHFETARRIWQSLHGESNSKVADCYHNIADLCKYKKSDFREAEIAYEKALSIREQIGLKDLPLQFRTYYSLAQTNRSQRDFEKALSYATQTLTIAKNLNNAIYQEMTHGVLASIYRDMDDSDQAKYHYQTAIQLNQTTHDTKTLGWYYQGLGETFKNDGQYEEAIKNLSKSHSLYVKEQARPALVLYLSMLLAETYSLVGNDDNFFKMKNELSRMFRSMGLNRSRQESQVFVIMGNHYSRKRNYDSALYYYQRALSSAVKTFNPRSMSDNPTEKMIGYQYYVSGILAKKASVLIQKFLTDGSTSNWRDAFECLVLSEKLLSQERNLLDLQDAKWEFLDANYNIYEDIIELLSMDKGFMSKDSLETTLFHYFEQSKARSLKDALSEVERSTQIRNQDSLLIQHASLRRKLLGVQDKLSAELERSDSSEAITKLRGEIVAIDRATEVCKQQIEKQYPGYFNIKYRDQYSSLSGLQKLIGKEKVIFEYFWGSESVFGMAITENTISFKKLGLANDISAIVDSTMIHFTDNSSVTDYASYARFATSAHSLYKILVSPLEQSLIGKKKIQIIPDGPISQIPFEIMLTEKANSSTVNYRSLQYLIKSFTVGYAYSASVLLNGPAESAWSPSLLAVSFTPSAEARAGSPDMQVIAGAEEEMKMLSARFAGGEFLTGQNATETNFKSIAPRFDILHLAIHGRGNVEKDFSASLYFDSEYDSIDDGVLHAYELYGLKLKATMAVLTACESGLGKGYRGEGMMSMANAFSYSGCQNILMSLWKVYDQQSQGLMNDFYGNLLDGNSIDDALRQTKLHYLGTADELSADPKVWAPMVAYGSLNEVFPKRTGIMIYTIAAVAAIVLLLFIIFRKKIVRKS